jgi:hypothetical protein
MKFALIGAATVAAVAGFAAPAMAQQVISDPGRCAQYYPDANCQNFGAGNPYTNGGYWRNSNAYMEQPRLYMQEPRLRHHERIHHG